jgi:uncharacterized HAD superfamily protein
MKRIAIDMDNTICTQISSSLAVDEAKTCKLRHPAIPEYIKDLRDAGNYIIIYTHRNSTLYMVTKEWLRKEEIVYDEIQMDKPHFDVLIDNDVTVEKLFPEGYKGR